jgi:hypothetical protein
MIVEVLAGLALACFVGAGLLLRTLGPNYRIARLLAGTPQVELAEALELAAVERPRYVRIAGRISSDEEFPDEHDRPLVYRRTRIETGTRPGRWQPVTQDTEAVAFGVEARTVFLAVDAAALGEGLVVVPREAVGSARDLGPDMAAGLDPEMPSRLVIEQISAVEHAVVAGVPQRDADGNPWISAGLGRPLILTTVEVPAAMRLLARGRRRTVIGVTLLLGAGAALAMAAMVALVATG